MAGDDPTPGELGRQLALLFGRFDKFDQALGELVRKDVYNADQRALRADLDRVQAHADRLESEAEQREKERVKDRSEGRRYLWAALLVCVATVIGEAIVRAILG